MSIDPVRPHPKLDRYYPSHKERPRMVRNLFDCSAPSYEWICNVMSFGTGQWYRRRVLIQNNTHEGTRLLDVATGTGLILRSANTLVGRKGLTVGLDPSRGMLTECQTSCGAPLVQAVGECLPFADNTFDVISFGYGLRHVEDLRQLFTDFFRVLSPGGRVVILEICVPRSLLARWCYRIYLGSILPKIVELGPGRKEARLLMEYFWDTIHNCVPPETILEELRKTGFGKSEHRVSFGGLGEYIATRSDEI